MSYKFIQYSKTPCCKNCKYARKAENSEFVGCCAAYRELKDCNDNAVFKFYNRSTIHTGWVDLGAGINDKGSGMITNGVPCFSPNDYCDHYKFEGED